MKKRTVYTIESIADLKELFSPARRQEGDDTPYPRGVKILIHEGVLHLDGPREILDTLEVGPGFFLNSKVFLRDLLIFLGIPCEIKD